MSKYYYAQEKYKSEDGEKDSIILMDITTSQAKKEKFSQIENTNDLDKIFSLTKLSSKITFYTYFQELVDNIPDNIVNVEFHANPIGPVNNLPNSIKFLCLGSKFSDSVDFLPDGLESLYLVCSKDFNHSIDNLPNNLDTLILSGEFNQPINHLPSNLKHLMFWCKFSHPLCKLPPNLESLIFIDDNFNHPIDYLPNSIKNLELNKNYDKLLPNIPTSIEHLVIRNPSYNWAPLFQLFNK